MIREFRTASIIPLRLNPFMERILAEKKYKPSPSVRDFLSRLMQPTPENEPFIYEAACHIIDIAQLLEKFGAEEFYYRQQKIYPSMYYLTISGSHINPRDAHYELPDDYEELARHYRMILEDRDQFDHPSVSVNAKFCYRVETLYLLSNFLKELRSGEKAPLDDNTKLEYDAIVRPASQLAGNEDSLAIEIFQLMKKINFFMNHHDDALCCYLTEALNHDDVTKALSPDSLYEQLPQLKSDNTRKIFDAAYEVFSALHDGDIHDIYNDMSEKIIAPINLCSHVQGGISPACVDYMIAHCALTASDNPEAFMVQFGGNMSTLYKHANSIGPAYDLFESYGMTRQNLRSMSASIEINDFIFRVLHMGGDHVSPVYDSEEIVYLYEKLNDTKDYEIDNPHLKDLWQKCRWSAVEHITEFFNKYPEAPKELGLQPIPN